jgi:hypothetical protein
LCDADGDANGGLPSIEMIVPSVQVLPSDNPNHAGSPAMVFTVLGMYR